MTFGRRNPFHATRNGGRRFQPPSPAPSTPFSSRPVEAGLTATPPIHSAPIRTLTALPICQWRLIRGSPLWYGAAVSAGRRTVPPAHWVSFSCSYSVPCCGSLGALFQKSVVKFPQACRGREALTALDEVQTMSCTAIVPRPAAFRQQSETF